MDERRRSARVPASLPVWLKDAHGGERTSTIDVSAHGVAVFTSKERRLRQYVELELTLPSEKRIALTAMVARPIEGGAALDFFALEAGVRQQWQAFLTDMQIREPPSPPPSKSIEEIEELPAFLVKPRDLGRLWAFYRGELARSSLRLESPVDQPVGSAVEVIVVHPSTDAEWPLLGEVAGRSVARAGRPLLDVRLTHVDTALRAAFRSYVASGSIPQTSLGETVHPPPLGLEEERLPSVMVDIQDLSEPGLEETDSLVREGEEATELREEATELRDDVRITPSPPAFSASAGEEPTRTAEDPLGSAALEEGGRAANGLQSIPWAEAVGPVPTSHPPRPPPPPPLEAADDEDDDLPELDPRVLEEVSTMSTDAADTRSRLIEEPILEASRSSGPEVSEVTEEPGPAPRPPRPEGPTMMDPVLPDDEDETLTAFPGEGFELEPVAPAAGAFSSFFQEAQRSNRHAAPQEAPASSPLVTPASSPRAAPVPSAPLMPADTVPAAGGLREITPPPATPGRYFEFGGGGGGAAPARETPTPRRRVADERLYPAHHHQVSTEGSNPGLDREIALARARVVRTPDDAAAAEHLAELLFYRGRSEVLQDAVRAYEKLIRLRPGDRAAHARLGELHARSGHYDRAAEHLRLAEKLGHPVDPDLEKIIALGQRDG